MSKPRTLAQILRGPLKRRSTLSLIGKFREAARVARSKSYIAKELRRRGYPVVGDRILPRRRS